MRVSEYEAKNDCSVTVYDHDPRNRSTTHCKECGGGTRHKAVARSCEDGTTTLLWVCANCYRVSPRQTRKAKTNSNGMTSAQEKAIERIKEQMVNNLTRLYEREYEIKNYKVQVMEHSGSVWLTVEVGQKNEGPLDSIYSRDQRSFIIRQRGGIEIRDALVNGTYRQIPKNKAHGINTATRHY